MKIFVGDLHSKLSFEDAEWEAMIYDVVKRVVDALKNAPAEKQRVASLAYLNASAWLEINTRCNNVCTKALDESYNSEASWELGDWVQCRELVFDELVKQAFDIMKEYLPSKKQAV